MKTIPVAIKHYKNHDGVPKTLHIINKRCLCAASVLMLYIAVLNQAPVKEKCFHTVLKQERLFTCNEYSNISSQEA
jgi:hypothetical protein